MAYQRKKRSHDQHEQLPVNTPRNNLFASPDLETDDADSFPDVIQSKPGPSLEDYRRIASQPSAYDFGSIPLFPKEGSVRQESQIPLVQRKPTVKPTGEQIGRGALQRITPQMGNASDIAKPQVNKRENSLGLPDALKTGVESASGISMDDVKVHYNSPKPIQLQALAYTQGTDIYVGPGQESHLSHEAWHVVQQKQGRVKPTIQAKRVAINDDQQLEKEADQMGKLASCRGTKANFPGMGSAAIHADQGKQSFTTFKPTIQRVSRNNNNDAKAIIKELKSRIRALGKFYGDNAVQSIKAVISGLSFEECWNHVNNAGISENNLQDMNAIQVSNRVFNEITLLEEKKNAQDWEENLYQQWVNNEIDKNGNDSTSNQNEEEEKVNNDPVVSTVANKNKFPNGDEKKLVYYNNAMNRIAKGVMAKQGLLGNCWLISSIVALGLRDPKGGLGKVIKKESGDGVNQTFRVKLYNVQVNGQGMMGKNEMLKGKKSKNVEALPEEIVVDTMLPVKKKKLVYAGRAMQQDERHVGRLVGLIEKAVAHKMGGWTKTQTGHPKKALPMLTGKPVYVLAPGGGGISKKNNLDYVIKNWDEKQIVATIASTRYKELDTLDDEAMSTYANRKTKKRDYGKSWDGGEFHSMVLKELTKDTLTVYDQGLGVEFKVPMQDYIKGEPLPMAKSGQKKAHKNRKTKDKHQHYLWKLEEITWQERK